MLRLGLVYIKVNVRFKYMYICYLQVGWSPSEHKAA